MRSVHKTSLLIAALCAPLVLTAGCTGSDVIGTGNSAVVVKVVVTSPNARFDRVSQMSVTQINVRPNNPDSDRSLGQFPVGVLATTADIINIDFRTPIEDPSQIVLSSGSYRINRLQFANLLLVQNNRPTTWTNCNEYFSWFFPQTIFEFLAADLGAQADFYVEGDGADEIVIEIDADAFVEAYTNSWNCVSTPTGPRPVTLNTTLFKSLSPTYLHIRG